MDLKALTTDQLETLIFNHEKNQKTDAPLYLQAKEEQERRNSRTLSTDVTREAILRSARMRKYLTYGDVAKENGVSWNKAYRPMGQHLDEVMRLAHLASEPLITSIVVNQKGLATGALDDKSLEGFLDGARRLGFDPQGGQAFLRAQQQKTFEFAARNI